MSDQPNRPAQREKLLSFSSVPLPAAEEDFASDPSELFFDLTYVFAFSRLVSLLVAAPTWRGFGEFVLSALQLLFGHRNLGLGLFQIQIDRLKIRIHSLQRGLRGFDLRFLILLLLDKIVAIIGVGRGARRTHRSHEAGQGQRERGKGSQMLLPAHSFPFPIELHLGVTPQRHP